MFSPSTLKEPLEDQPLPADASPTALSPGYVVDSDPKKDEKDPKEDPADYLADRGSNDDDESSNDDDDVDDVENDEEDKEEEGHLAPADPFDVSTDNLVPLKLRIQRHLRLMSLLLHHLPFLPPPLENVKSLKDNIKV
uniref:Uncharacterized protein n=1 Tax=Tanacetum cinerariifolium TaxID=118510 RepID=A0A699QGY3_TANCI|nr:hypothetical protein [Tanacetum cinerariifolium]